MNHDDKLASSQLMGPEPRKLFLELPITDGTNTIVSAHNSVVAKGMFDSLSSQEKLRLEEGGFYVISRENGELRLEHEFHYFKDFMKVFYLRE